jgi:hypothetical protein
VQLRRRALDLCKRALAKKDDIVAELSVPAPLARYLASTLERNGARIERRLGATA